MALDGVMAQGEERRVARSLGVRVGAGVALACILAAVAYGWLVDRNPDGMIPVVLALVLPTLAAGSIGGRLFGPAAWRAVGRMEWLGIVLGLAVAAIVIGAAAIGVELFIGSLLTDNPQLGLPERLGSGVVYWGLATIAGPFILGPAAFPFTVTGAAAWAMVVRARRPRRAES